jgi:hypothetical protein
MHFEISSIDKIFCTGVQTGYFVDLARKRPVPVPAKLLFQYEESIKNK